MFHKPYQQGIWAILFWDDINFKVVRLAGRIIPETGPDVKGLDGPGIVTIHTDVNHLLGQETNQ